MKKPTILFVSENVTLAQVVRLRVLAGSLPSAEYDVHFASSEFSPMVFQGTDFHCHELHTVRPEEVTKALAKGKRIYERSTLDRYVKAELELFSEVRPDVVIGDFRLSLSTSAALAGVPLATLINAYWSPFAQRDGFPVPDHPVVRLLGEEMTAKYFPLAQPKVFAHFAAPINALRRKHGLSEIGGLSEVLTYGDMTLYADTPGLVPTSRAPARHRYLGPVIWSPRVPLDPGLLARRSMRPLVYVTLGSSGTLSVLPAVVEALSLLPVDVVLSTLDRVAPSQLPKNFSVYSLVPGDEVARLASVVISNGGSTTSYQALAQGTPVVGLPSNLDQYLAMTHIEKSGAGVLLKARNTTAEEIAHAVTEVLTAGSYRLAARRVQREFSTYDSAQELRAVVDALVERSPAAVGG